MTGYAGRLVDWAQALGGYVLAIVRRPRDSHRFEVLPRRWVVERTFAWLGRCRRLSKDFEALPEHVGGLGACRNGASHAPKVEPNLIDLLTHPLRDCTDIMYLYDWSQDTESLTESPCGLRALSAPRTRGVCRDLVPAILQQYVWPLSRPCISFHSILYITRVRPNRSIDIMRRWKHNLLVHRSERSHMQIAHDDQWICLHHQEGHARGRLGYTMQAHGEGDG